jgi:hypothetical protein
MTIIAIVNNDLILDVRKRILQMAERENIDSTTFLAALADVVGIEAAVFEQTGQPYQRVTIDARLDAFTDRARETFYRVQRDQIDHRVISHAVEQGRLRT